MRPIPPSLALLGAGVLGLAACGGAAGAAAPPADAPPSQVVRAYLDAVQQGDDDTAAAVSTPDYAASDPWQRGTDP